MKNKKGPGPPDDETPSDVPDPPAISNNNCSSKEQYSPCQESLTNSTGSERESDSACVCGSPNDHNIKNDTFDWWFHRNRNSHKSR